MNNLAVRENQIMGAFELDNIKSQLSNLLDNNPKKMESFRTKILKIGLSFGLDKCNPESIINCGLQALTISLPLEHGQGYIVNYGGKATFDCGYKGWQVLAERAGYSVLADAVYSCDEFSQTGFGFERDIIFNPDFTQRQSANDIWAKKNLTAVIVSIKAHDTNTQTYSVVNSDMIHKIVGMSPGQQSEKGKKFSPHSNWSEQMFMAKAIKQVLSKFPIDIDKAADLSNAIEIVNNTEMQAQEQFNHAQKKPYANETFESNFPKWKTLVESGKKPAMAIITQLSNTLNLNQMQLEKLYELRNFEPIESEVA